MSGLEPPSTIVALARGWMGTPYRHQAALKGAGCDCLGLVRGVLEELGQSPPAMPPYAADWRRQTAGDGLMALADCHLVRADKPAPGQVLVFRIGPDGRARHCGIATEPDRFIHAQEGLGVVEVYLTEGWLARIAGRFAFPTGR